jgi:hypothetical protein
MTNAKKLLKKFKKITNLNEDHKYFVDVNCYEHGLEVVFGGGSPSAFATDIIKFLNFYYRGGFTVNYRNNIVTVSLGNRSSLEDSKEVGELIKKFVFGEGGKVYKTNF